MYGPPWTPEQDAILLAAPSAEAAARILGKSGSSCRLRRKRLRRAASKVRRFWTPEEDAMLASSLSLRAVAKALGRSRPACQSRRQHLALAKPEPSRQDFLALLAQHERPPANVAVREHTPVRHNPSAYHGSGCSSPANMD